MVQVVNQCTRCGQWKDDEAFGWRNQSLGRRQTYCRDCRRAIDSAEHKQRTPEQKAEDRERNQNRIDSCRRYVWDYLSTHACVDCGESDPVVLEFDHMDATQKIRHISEMVARGVALSTLQAEIAKCQVRCVNCHRIKTFRERGGPGR